MGYFLLSVHTHSHKKYQFSFAHDALAIATSERGRESSLIGIAENRSVPESLGFFSYLSLSLANEQFAMKIGTFLALVKLGFSSNFASSSFVFILSWFYFTRAATYQHLCTVWMLDWFSLLTETECNFDQKRSRGFSADDGKLLCRCWEFDINAAHSTLMSFLSFEYFLEIISHQFAKWRE